MKQREVTTEDVQHLDSDIRQSYLLDKRFRILYCVPFERESLEDVTEFRHYSENLLYTTRLHVLAARLPADVREISEDWHTIYHLRATSVIQRANFPIYLDSFLEADKLLSDYLFRVVLTDARTADCVDKLLQASPYRWIHLSTAEIKNERVSAERITWEDFRELLRSIYLSSPSKDNSSSAVLTAFEKATEKAATEPDANLLHEPRGHGITGINEHAAYCFGVHPPMEEEKPLTSTDRQVYVDAVLRSTQEVFSRRAQLSGANTPTCPYRLALAVPSLIDYLYSSKFSKDNNLRRQYPVLHRFVLEIARQGSYFYRLATQDLRQFFSDKAVQALFYISMRELASFSDSLTVFAARTLTPVVRLEPNINSVKPRFAKIAQLSRGTNPRRKYKTNQAAIEAMRDLSGAIAVEYRALLSNPSPSAREGVKLVTDLPLEWLPVGKLPLMMAFETSRIPATPGNVNFEQLITDKTVHLPISAFSKVRVIRSFFSDDPIRGVLEDAVSRMDFAAGQLPINVEFVDVNGVDEFVAAWNSSEGAMLIFDGHGAPNAHDDGVGTLIIGGVPVNVWDLKGRLLTQPPIVIVSACDTHAVDSGHATIGNALLMLGAKSALATLLPVDARYSAFLIARLLLRVSQFVPIAASTSLARPLTWRTVITGMQRMTYVTEVMMAVAEEERNLTQELLSDVQLEANIAINGGDPQWHQKFVSSFARVRGESDEKTLEVIERWASLVDVMLYVHLGSPESIIIVPDAE